MLNSNKPNFTVNNGNSSSSEGKEKRNEKGAIWERVSKNNKKYMTVKLTFTPEELQNLIDNSGGENININLVGFTNTEKSNPRQPSIRLYEEKYNKRSN